MDEISRPGLAERCLAAGDDLWSDGRGWILVVVSVGWFLSFGTRFVFPALLPEIRTVFFIDNTTAGLLMSTLWLAYGLGQFPGGVIGDWMGERRTLLYSLIVAVISLVALVLSPGLSVVFVATAVFGLATALYSPTSFTVPMDLYTDRVSTATGIVLAAGHAGSTVLPLLAGILATYFVWSVGFGVLVPLFLLASVAVWVVVPDRTGPDRNEPDDRSEAIALIGTALGQRRVQVASLMLMAIVFIMQGFSSFYPAYLVDTKGISEPVAAGMLSGFFAAGIVVSPLGGIFADRVGERTALSVVLSLLSLSLLGLVLAESIVPLGVATLGLSSLLAAITIGLTYLTSALPPTARGSSFGLIRSLYFLVSATGPIIVGVLADQGRFDDAFVLLAAVAGIAFVVLRTAGRAER